MAKQSTRFSTKGANTRQRILDVALGLFARHGYNGLRLDDVAEAVGIRRPSLYHHFSDKPELYAAVWERAVVEQEAFLAPHFDRADLSAEQLLDIAIDAWIDYAFSHQDFIYLLLHALASGQTRDFPLGASTPPTVRRWQELLDRGVAEGSFRPILLVECLALIGGMLSFYIATPDNLVPELAKPGGKRAAGLASHIKQALRSLLLT